MEAIDIKIGMNVLNERSKNIGIIPEIGEDAHIFNDNRVLVLRLVTQGRLEGRYVAVYWQIGNLKDISSKSLFSQASEEKVLAQASIH